MKEKKKTFPVTHISFFTLFDEFSQMVRTVLCNLKNIWRELKNKTKQTSKHETKQTSKSKAKAKQKQKQKTQEKAE